VFHRVARIERLAGPRFFALAWRIAAYPGAVAAVRARHVQRRVAAANAEPVTLGQWAAAHPDALVAAGENWNDDPRR
jgi:hypothetical protein